MQKKITNNGKKGGMLKGKPHYDKQGNSVGGIKAVVTDAGGKPVELEGGEVIINKEASKKYWRELSKINQSAGNGVAIGPPTGMVDEDPAEEYGDGGKIEFNANKLPNKWILSYAKKIKKNHPEIWKLGGNIFGNEAFNNLSRVAERGYWLDSEEWMYKKWQSYVARHHKDYRIEGVVAMLKWVDKVDKGWPYMKQLIEDKIEKLSKKGKGWKHKSETKMKDGGPVDETPPLTVKKYILNRQPKKDDIFQGGKVDGYKVVKIRKLKKHYGIIYEILLLDTKPNADGQFNRRIVDYTPETKKIGDFQQRHLTATQGKYYTPWYDIDVEDKMKDGGPIDMGSDKFMQWYLNWYKGVSDLMNITFSLPNQLQPFKENNVVILDLFEKKNQSIDAKKYLDEIVKKADELGVVIYLEPKPRHKYFFNNKAKKEKITKEYLIDYYTNFGFEVTQNKEFMKRLPKMKSGGRTVSQTPAPASDRIKGSKVNPKGTASTSSKASTIKFSDKVLSSIQSLIDEHNKKYPSKKITLEVAKAVVRRGMGAYSSSHRPTISGGQPNDRTAWGLARLKAFIYKAQKGKSKSGKFSQDNDLFEELDILVDKYRLGGELAMGIKAEHEHSQTIGKFKKPGVSDLQVETAIAKDHLKEDPHYYSKLKKMEAKKYDGGGLIDANGVEFTVGDKGIYGRKKDTVQITAISVKLVYYYDILDITKKQKSAYIDQFVKGFQVVKKPSVTTTVKTAPAQAQMSTVYGPIVGNVDIKFDTNNNEMVSDSFQKFAFKLGCFWDFGSKQSVRYNNARYLYISKEKVLSFGTNTEFFNEHEGIQITLEQIKAQVELQISPTQSIDDKIAEQKFIFAPKKLIKNLPPYLRELALINQEKQNGKRDENIDLHGAFTFSETPEGGSFWSSILLGLWTDSEILDVVGSKEKLFELPIQPSTPTASKKPMLQNLRSVKVSSTDELEGKYLINAATQNVYFIDKYYMEKYTTESERNYLAVTIGVSPDENLIGTTDVLKFTDGEIKQIMDQFSPDWVLTKKISGEAIKETSQQEPQIETVEIEPIQQPKPIAPKPEKFNPNLDYVALFNGYLQNNTESYVDVTSDLVNRQISVFKTIISQ